MTVSAETSTVNASKVSSASETWTGTANETWTVTVDGGATGQNVTNSYAQIGTRNSPSTSITISTSSIPGTITSIVLDCASYNGLGTVSATVGGAAFGTQSQSIPSWSSNAGGEVTFEGEAFGTIVLTMTNGSGGRAMYVKSITVTYRTAAPTEPAITVGSTEVSVPYEGEEGIIPVTYANFTDVAADVAFFAVDGTTKADYDWITAEIDDDNNVSYLIEANEGEARTAYMKVWAYDDDLNEVYSNLVTISQAAFSTEWTWDLSQVSYDANPTKELISWSSNYATMTNEKGTGSTDVTNYIPSTRTSTRFYTNNILTISPADGYAITSVVFTATSDNYASALASSTWTNASASANDVTVTVVPTNGQNDIVAMIGATCGFTSVTVNYVEVPAPITVTVSSAGWATFAPSKDVQFDNEVMSAFIVTGATTTSATLTAVSAVPAGTPVLVSAEAGTYTLAAASTTPAAVTGNKLNVSDGNVTGDESTIYALGVQSNDEVGFMLVADGVEIPAGKCYLQITTSGARSFLSLGGGEDTAIKSVATDVNEGTVYDLQGRRVNGVKQGLYIVNGKKVVLK